MIDWLRGSSNDPQVNVGGRVLPVAIRRHPRAKRLTMRLAPDGSEVRVTMPAWGRTREAVDFAASRHDWLAAQLARVPQVAPVAPGATLPYRGVDLVVDWQPKAPRRPARSANGWCWVARRTACNRVCAAGLRGRRWP